MTGAWCSSLLPGAHWRVWFCSSQVTAFGRFSLSPFSPRLVGPVLNGTADHNSAINLHLFADSAEAVAITLRLFVSVPSSACTSMVRGGEAVGLIAELA